MGHRSGDEPQLGDSTVELGDLVRTWRRRLRPDQVPGFGVYPARRRDHVSQDDVARLVGSTSYWYGELERGRVGGYSDDFLDRVAVALRLTEAEREVLYYYAAGREPAATYTPSTEVSKTFQRMVDVLPLPAYVSDIAWDVLYANRHISAWFPWLPREPNVMRWTFTYPEARLQLAKWDTDWAPPMIAQMRLVHARYHDNQRLTQLIEEILAVNDDARRLWAEDLAVKGHPDGDRRMIYVPGRDDPIEIEIMSLGPHRDPTQRLVLLVPLSPDTNPGIDIPLLPGDRDVYPVVRTPR
jgi:transcriptional regulator with XRE-family HTH domain